MTNTLTIVMYHYVREIRDSPYPNLRGLEIDGFRRQLDFLQKHYQIISAEQLIQYVRGELPSLPKHSCLLSFDDGYKDHIRYVLPELLKRSIHGSFFPVAKPICKHTLLDVNALHYIIACSETDADLVKSLDYECRQAGLTSRDIELYRQSINTCHRFDSPEIIYFKRMLQRELPSDLRSRIISLLFQEYVDKSETLFSEELYLSLADVQELVLQGMYVGSHSYHHHWMNKESLEFQISDIEKSLEFLRNVDAPTTDWIMCYPYGAYNSDTLAVVTENRCLLGLTTNVGPASLEPKKLLELSRYDTNDFPQ